MVFHIPPDFDVVETPDATLIAKFIGKKKSPPHGEAEIKAENLQQKISREELFPNRNVIIRYFSVSKFHPKEYLFS